MRYTVCSTQNSTPCVNLWNQKTNYLHRIDISIWKGRNGKEKKEVTGLKQVGNKAVQIPLGFKNNYLRLNELSMGLRGWLCLLVLEPRGPDSSASAFVNALGFISSSFHPISVSFIPGWQCFCWYNIHRIFCVIHESPSHQVRGTFIDLS